MKRILFFIFIFISISCSAQQIQRKFFSCNIGTDTYDICETKLQKQGFNIDCDSKANIRTITIEDPNDYIYFGGFSWIGGNYYFINKKFVGFSLVIIFNSKKIQMEEEKKLSQKLSEKYSAFKAYEFSFNNDVSSDFTWDTYIDNKMECRIKTRDSNNMYYLILEYKDFVTWQNELAKDDNDL